MMIRYTRGEYMNWVAPIKDDETLQKFRDALRSVDDKYYILFEIGIGTGLQLQDILQFKVKDVRGKDMLIAVIGTRQIEQAFPLKPELQAVITDFIDGRDDEEYLITGYASTNRPLSREQAYRIFKQTGNKIGLKSIGTQTMRKTFAWRYYKETGDIQYIQNLLNHASPNITFRYIGEKPNIKVIYDKITDDGNQKAMEYLLKDKKGVRDIDAIILELKTDPTQVIRQTSAAALLWPCRYFAGTNARYTAGFQSIPLVQKAVNATEAASVTLTAFLPALTTLFQNICFHLAQLLRTLFIDQPQCLDNIDMLLIIFLNSQFAAYITMFRAIGQTIVRFRSCRKPMHFLPCCTSALITFC